MMGGNWNRILFVNLSTGDISVEEPGGQLYHDFLGGYGLGARIIYSRQKPGVDPLGPDNTLGFTTGVLIGTGAVGATRFTVCGKSPLTGTWGDANSGGYLAAALKKAGFDAVFFTGASEEPVYLTIEDGEAELRDASHLWGKDTFETEAALKDEWGDDTQVACIGPAGEKLSLISAVIHDRGRAAARSGLGAVMGSKRLKAVAVRGSLTVPVADEACVKELRREHLRVLREDESVAYFRKYGTVSHVASSTFTGDSPTKNWKGVGLEDFPQAEAISDDNVIKYEQKKYGCYRCPIACGGIYRVEDGPYAVETTQKAEYETCAMFGSNLLNDDIESIIKANEICNRYGLDTISTAATIAFAFECYEQGLISKEDAGGLELEWGNADAIVRLTRMIAEREGLGDLLAEGSSAAAEKLGGNAAEFAIHAGGQELAAHDPRYAPSLAVNAVAEAAPGRHTLPGLGWIEWGSGLKGIPIPDLDKYEYRGKAELNTTLLNLWHAVYSSGVCLFVLMKLDLTVWPDMINAVTGWDYTWDSLLETGARIAAMRQAFNVREGVPVAHIHVSGRGIGHPPLESGPLAGVSIDLETQKQEFYQVRGWDVETGVPLKETLVALGLNDVADDG
ncbi:MAG: aldehyde ferredoxin oxidoreductase family protein [Anaerolineae bacterium]|jgi:aldehyde:ferredoxin oxidoreductase